MSADPLYVRGAIAAVVGVLALAGCGSSAPAEEKASFLGDSCAVEIGIARDATGAAVATFTRRLRRTRHVARVDVVPRATVLGRFERALRQEGYTGARYRRLMRRAQAEAGPTLLAIPDEKQHVPHIVDALQELPAAVTSVFDRPSCARG